MKTRCDCGRELLTGDTEGKCIVCRNKKFFDPPPPTIPVFGWICPRCGISNAPFLARCVCPPPSFTTTSDST